MNWMCVDDRKRVSGIVYCPVYRTFAGSVGGNWYVLLDVDGNQIRFQQLAEVGAGLRD
jgi:hypothetical protein